MRQNLPDQQLVKVFTALCDELDTSLSRRLKKSAIEGDWATIVKTKVDPSDYVTASYFYKDSLVANFLRKLPITVEGLNPTDVTYQGFLANEQHNHQTNLRLMRFCDNYGLEPGDHHLVEFFSQVKKRISSILGRVPDSLVGKFGKGSTFTDIGEFTTLPDKMSTRSSITPEARDLLPLFRDTAWVRALLGDHQSMSDPDTVRGNRFTTVRKTALSDRGICIEPSWNVFMQLAIGSYFSERLAKAGLVKELSQDIHRIMARQASLTGRLATLDLTDASDLVCYQFVRLVMPDDWFQVLCATRSAFTLVKGKWVKVEKFSSMGNGFTFELMTLILLSVADTLCQKHGVKVKIGENLSVYGDDIIVPIQIVPDFLACLSFLGLKLNVRKTFTSGSFRESCGGDYFDGIDVSPFYLKEFPNEPQQHIALANALRRMGRQYRDGIDGFPAIRKPWFRALDGLPSHIRRLRGPEHLGDLVVHDDYDRWYEPTGTRRKNLAHRETPDRRKFVRGYVPINKTLSLDKWSPLVMLACALYGVPSCGVVPRRNGKDVVKGYRVRWTAVGW